METKNVKNESNNIDQLFLHRFSIDVSMDLDKILIERQNVLALELKVKLDNFISLYDEGIKLVINIHKFCEFKHSKTMKDFSLVVLTAKMISLLLGMRKLIYAGMMDSIKTLNRTFIETIDLFFACLQNNDFSNSYANKTEMYDNNEFYWKNVSKKVNKMSIELIRSLGAQNDRIEHFINRRKNLNEFLSNATHASYNSSFTNYFHFGLDLTVETGIHFGKVTTAYPNMILEILEDINILIIQKNT